MIALPGSHRIQYSIQATIEETRCGCQQLLYSLPETIHLRVAAVADLRERRPGLDFMVPRAHDYLVSTIQNLGFQETNYTKLIRVPCRALHFDD